MSRTDSLILSFLSRFGIDPTAGDLAVGELAAGDPAAGDPAASNPAVTRISPYRVAPTVWGVAELPVPVGRQVAPPAEDTAVDRRRPRRSRRLRRRLEVVSLPRPRGLIT